MRNKLFSEDKTEYKRFFNTVEKHDNTPRKQYTKFLKWCFDNGFFNNISDENIDNYYIYEYLPLLKNNGIYIGTYILKDKATVGIDPSKCFNKISQCSIIINFPVSKREEQRIYKLLEILINDKNKQTKAWKKEAKEYWYGSYATFE